jgi:hypothetical protein
MGFHDRQIQVREPPGRQVRENRNRLAIDRNNLARSEPFGEEVTGIELRRRRASLCQLLGRRTAFSCATESGFKRAMPFGVFGNGNNAVFGLPEVQSSAEG